MAADECQEPDYDKNVDYILKLNNHLGHIKQLDAFQWDESSSGPANEPKHLMTARLNGVTIGVGKWRSKARAKKVAAFYALKYLGQL